MPPELIETLLIDAERRVPLLARHLARLQSSCLALDYAYPGQDVSRAIEQAIESLPATAGAQRLRLLVKQQGQFTLELAPLAPLPLVQEIMLAPAALQSDEPLLRHKTTYRPWYVEAAEWLPKHPHVFDWIFVNERGELCEGSRSNLYLQLNGVWYTPPLSSGCLPGVQRADLLAREQATERVLTLQDLHNAPGVRLSNALRGWFDVLLHNY